MPLRLNPLAVLPKSAIGLMKEILRHLLKRPVVGLDALTFDEVIRQGLVMSDPSLLVTNPTHTDPSKRRCR